MRILVTGGCGFIGSAVVRHLIAHTPHEVRNLDALTYAATTGSTAIVADHPRYGFGQTDITDAGAVDAAFADFRPHVVIHLAAETHVDRSIDDPDAFVRTNVIGTMHLLRAARRTWAEAAPADRSVARFVHVSTDEVFGSLGFDDPPFTPASCYRPSSPYAASKAAADHLARAWHTTHGLPVVVTNCSNNYGPFQFPEKLIPLVTLKALAGDEIGVYGDGANVRDWLFVEDHAAALVAVAERGVAGSTYLVGAASERPNLEIVETICDLVDELRPSPAGPRRRLVRFVDDRPGHDLRYAIDPSLTVAGLEWEPAVGFAEGLRRTVRWYLENQWWWAPITEDRYDGGRLGAP